jgi:TonB family protein
VCVLHLDGISPRSPRISQSRSAALTPIVTSIALHAFVISGAVALMARTMRVPKTSTVNTLVESRGIEAMHLVYVARNAISPAVGHGGGGGGNRQPSPIRRAQGIGSDAMTLRIARPLETTSTPADILRLPGVLLEARPLASGAFDQIGLPTGGEQGGSSTGAGSGGGVGTGVGTGIGAGSGPGIGPGSGGGMGGGIYRPGGGVSPPRVIRQVKPSYTPGALLEKIQGTVVVELVVDRTGHPGRIHVVRSLDPEGLDQQAIVAVGQWRFEPGRLAGTPVDVLVTIALDFWIH